MIVLALLVVVTLHLVAYVERMELVRHFLAKILLLFLNKIIFYSYLHDDMLVVGKVNNHASF
jgi:hypothetical protein